MEPDADPEVAPKGVDTRLGKTTGEVEVGVEALTNLGLRLVRSLEHAHLQQGVTIKDLLWVLHGAMGQVLAWAYARKLR